MSELTARMWLNAMTESITRRDLAAHMALVSRNVQVYGLPGDRTIDYEGWHKRRRNELRKGLLASLTYSDLSIHQITLRRIRFKVTETMTAANGACVIIDQDIIIEQEDGEHWRVVEENINHWEHGGTQQHNVG